MPVIGTTPGGHSEMIDQGTNGLLVPANDVDALATAMRLLIDDDQLRESMREPARSAAAEYVASVAVPRFERLLEAVLERSRAQLGPPLGEPSEQPG